MHEELNYEIQDVKRAISALQLRVTKIEEFALRDKEAMRAVSLELAPRMINFTPPINKDPVPSPMIEVLAIQAVTGAPNDDPARGLTEDKGILSETELR